MAWDGQQRTVLALGPCYSHGRLLAVAWPSPGFCSSLGGELVIEHLSLPPSFPLPSPFSIHASIILFI